jgi:hypothetical protein
MGTFYIDGDDSRQFLKNRCPTEEEELDPADLVLDDARGLLPDAAPTIRDLGVHDGHRRG